MQTTATPGGTSAPAEDFREPLDMDAVAQAAITKKNRFKLTYECQGKEFVWQGRAKSQALAEARARADLSDQEPQFNRYKAQLIASVEEVLS